LQNTEVAAGDGQPANMVKSEVDGKEAMPSFKQLVKYFLSTALY